MPARKMKAGAQKWVIQRVKKMPGVGPPAGRPEYTRTWSIAIRIMTAPRIRSMDAIRAAAGAAVVALTPASRPDRHSATAAARPRACACR